MSRSDEPASPVSPGVRRVDMRQFVRTLRRLRKLMEQGGDSTRLSLDASVYRCLVVRYMRMGHRYRTLRRFITEFPPAEPLELAYFCIQRRCLAVGEHVMQQFHA